MKRRSAFSCMLILITMGTLGTVEAQPTHPTHRYMVAEHTALNQLTGLLSSSFHAVHIKRLDVPTAVEAGEDVVYSVVANVETATLPISGIWEFGGDVTKKGLSVRHTFTEPGTYEVTVRVANEGSSDDRTFMLEVLDPDQQS